MSIFLSNFAFVSMAGWAVVALITAVATLLRMNLATWKALSLHDGIRFGAMARQMMVVAFVFATVALAAIVWQVFVQNAANDDTAVLVGIGAFFGIFIIPMIGILVDRRVVTANKRWQEDHTVHVDNVDNLASSPRG